MGEVEEMTDYIKLINVIAQLENLSDKLTIYAARNPVWTSESRAIVRTSLEDEPITLELGSEEVEYFLEVSIAKEVIQGWKTNVSTKPSPQEICEMLIHYAEYDA